MTSKELSDIANSEAASTLVKKLWPTMLFIIIMSLITLFGGHYWSKDLDIISITISYWLWFIAVITITGFASYAFILDTGIQLKGAQQKNNNINNNGN